MRILAFAAATALTFAGAYYVRTRNANAMLSQSVQPPATPSGLGLKLEAQGDRLLLSWNRQNALVRHAQSGSLQIDDGPQKRLVSLDAVQVANGAILYHPSSDDVTFRLEVHGIDGTQAIDTMRVLDSAKPAALDLSPEAPVRKSAPSPAGQPAVTIPSSKLDRTPGKTIPETQTPRHEEEIRPPLAEAKASGNAVKTAPVAAPPPSEPVKEATSKPSEEVQAVPEDAPVKPAFTPQLTSPPATSPAISSAPPKAAPLPKVEGTNAPAATRTAPVPAVNKPEISSYQPPRPVRQVLPNVSGLPPSVMAMAGQVEILVKVTAQGNVSDAYPGHTNQKVSAVLVGVALNAAKQWHFQPAVLGGKAVPSEHSIVFQFARPH